MCDDALLCNTRWSENDCSLFFALGAKKAEKEEESC